MATIIHGIAASENIDSSGERLLIKGMDISSLDQDGVFNWEHESKQPDQVVGKILMAKKIYCESDCDTDEQRHFWRKIETPYIYVKGELFDDYKDSAKEVAGMFKYDSHNSHERNVMNFSVEGHKIEKKGIEVTRSIARKVTITVTPCNKAAIAEMLPQKDLKKDEFDGIFKSEGLVEIALFPIKKSANEDKESHASALGIEPMKKADPLNSIAGDRAKRAEVYKQRGDKQSQAIAQQGSKEAHQERAQGIKDQKKPDLPKSEDEQNDIDKSAGASVTPIKPKAPVAPAHGTHIGTTSTGREIHSHKQVHEYGMMSPTEHREAASMHDKIATKSPDMAHGTHHKNKAMLHLQAAHTATRREAKLKAHKSSTLLKAMDAGSAMAAPSDLKQGAALAKEDLKGKKKKRLAKADEIYQAWDKKEEFIKFMQARLPGLTKFEIDAIGRAVALKKGKFTDALKKIPKAIVDGFAHAGAAEAGQKMPESKPAPKKIEKALKFGSEADQKAVAEAEEKRKANPPKKAEKKAPEKSPDFKKPFDSEVEKIHTSVGHTPKGAQKFDRVHLKTGHVSEGHDHGKFKVGDKVSARPHIMGTHILEHKKD